MSTGNARQPRQSYERYEANRTGQVRREPVRQRRQPPQNEPRRPRNPVLIVALVALAVLIVIFLVRCSGSDPAPQSPYNWSNLNTSGQFYSYTSKNGEAAKVGIDVSHHNGTIDWQKVANDNIDFAYVRIGYRGYTEGNIQLDSTAFHNILGAKTNGIPVGLYVFSQSITTDEAVEEADFVCDFADLFQLDKSYPVAFDMEENQVENERIDELSTDERTSIALAFCEEVEKRGYTPVIYGNNMWLNGKFDLATISKYQLWLADYNATPSATYMFKFWQYTHTGSVDGIDGDVDIDLMFADE